ncbi:MAG TPA: flavodoxin [Gammaproteobacteria bacterium]|jgi:flavodoxin long chain|nr:flavodoxin [Gammaproteobacteria bacterium]
MKTYGLLYAAGDAPSERIGEKICTAIWSYGHPVRILTIADAALQDLARLRLIVMGVPMTSSTDVHSDWCVLEQKLGSLDLSQSYVALYGIGDQKAQSGCFMDTMGRLHQRARAAGATMVGYWPVRGYRFSASNALVAGKTCFAGLAIDEHNQSELTAQRVSRWVRGVMRDIESLELA